MNRTVRSTLLVPIAVMTVPFAFSQDDFGGPKDYIVGHTDMVGDAASNVKLSQARAQSVITALVSKHGIGAARLIAFGAGPYAPVATNKTDEGTAKNRRVELVKIATK
jgi:outer membrane protein OmpA-like peptidoglycan-associated protein